MGIKPIKPESAFRARSNADQSIPAGTFTKIFFADQQFDLNEEYIPGNTEETSVFVPKKAGVYAIMATVEIVVDNPSINQIISLAIRVNGNLITITDYFFTPVVIGEGEEEFVIDFIGPQVNTIYQLATGDVVDVVMIMSGSGTAISGNLLTHFEAARFPSPENLSSLVNSPTT